MMQIVTDRGADLSPQQLQGLNLFYVPFKFSLDGKDYSSGEDITPDEFYKLLTASTGFPSTTQPAPGLIMDTYRKAIASGDKDILSIHVSSGLSGTVNAARLAAEMMKDEANITIHDTKTLSGGEGWQVEAAARAAKAGWPLEKIIDLLNRISSATDLLFTLSTLKYLVHGGRISHMKGMAANMLNLKPIIAVEKTEGKYVQRGTGRTLSRTVLSLAEQIEKQYKPGTRLRLQIMQGNNPEDAEALRNKLNGIYDATWLPTESIAPVFGAHTGPGLVGVVFGPQNIFDDLP